MSRFTGKVALITGASSGIGEAIAIAFAKEGAKVAITGRNKERLSKVARDCEVHEGCEVLEVIVDVINFEELKPLVDKTVERFGGIDILVNNAGTGNLHTLTQDYDLKYFSDVINVNVRAPVFLSKYALPHLKKNKGCIINVSSIGSSKALPGGVVYCMSKCALDNFTQGLAAEYAKDGIRVNSINPGVVDTRILYRSGLSQEQIDETVKQLGAAQPFGILQSMEVADVVLYICATPRMTGSNVVLDGGFHLDK